MVTYAQATCWADKLGIPYAQDQDTVGIKRKHMLMLMSWVAEKCESCNVQVHVHHSHNMIILVNKKNLVHIKKFQL